VLFKILSYTHLFLNCRWFTFIVLLTRALEVTLLLDSWHAVVPRARSWSLLRRSRRSLLSHNRRRSLLRQITRRMSSTAMAIAMTHLTTLH
jgi:hypothetical protein